ncbi:hypothetical protein OROMI_021936 [Orobanche minor]
MRADSSGSKHWEMRLVFQALCGLIRTETVEFSGKMLFFRWSVPESSPGIRVIPGDPVVMEDKGIFPGVNRSSTTPNEVRTAFKYASPSPRGAASQICCKKGGIWEILCLEDASSQRVRRGENTPSLLGKECQVERTKWPTKSASPQREPLREAN